MQHVSLQDLLECDNSFERVVWLILILGVHASFGIIATIVRIRNISLGLSNQFKNGLSMVHGPWWKDMSILQIYAVSTCVLK